MDRAKAWVSNWVKWAGWWKVKFRMEEVNTLSGGGLRGASDTLAAALFYVDFSLAMMQVSVFGIGTMDENILLPNFIVTRDSDHVWLKYRVFYLSMYLLERFPLHAGRCTWPELPFYGMRTVLSNLDELLKI